MSKVFLDELNILQPDVLVLTEADRILPGGSHDGIPLLVVEVLSPSTAHRDRSEKAETYLRAGVREVWLVDPDTETQRSSHRGRIRGMLGHGIR